MSSKVAGRSFFWGCFKNKKERRGEKKIFFQEQNQKKRSKIKNNGGVMATKESTKELLEKEIKKREKELIQRSFLVKGEKEALRAVSSGDSSGDHSASGATYEVDYEGVRLSRINSEMTLLVQLKAKVDTGEYGICHDCGGAIGEKRLKVMPLAENCIDCASKKEAAQKRLYRKGSDPTKRRYAFVRV